MPSSDIHKSPTVREGARRKKRTRVVARKRRHLVCAICHANDSSGWFRLPGLAAKSRACSNCYRQVRVVLALNPRPVVAVLPSSVPGKRLGLYAIVPSSPGAFLAWYSGDTTRAAPTAPDPSLRSDLMAEVGGVAEDPGPFPKWHDPSFQGFVALLPREQREAAGGWLANAVVAVGEYQGRQRLCVLATRELVPFEEVLVAKPSK
eukprot:m51a1_g2028 hypothetical protein (205) ;mRNA; r:1310321-1311035